MSFRRALAGLCFFWLVAGSFLARAESIRPRLSKARFDSLRNALLHSRPDTNRVKTLLLLSQDFIYQYDDQPNATNLRTGLAYGEQAAALSQQLHFAAGRIGSLYVRGQLHQYLAQDTLGQKLIWQGVAESERRHYPRLAAYGWLYLGECYEASPAGLATKLTYFRRSRALFRLVGDKANEAYMLKCVADVHLQQRNPAQTIRELLEVEALYRSVGHRRLQYTYDLLHATYRQLGDYKEALRYGLAALARAQATNDTIMLGGLYYRLGRAYHDLKQYPEALVYYQKALQNYQQNDNAVNTVSIAGAIVRVMLAQHRAQEGLAFFTRVAKPYAAASPRVTERIANYLLELHSALGHYTLAEPYAAQMVTFLKSGAADLGEQAGLTLALGRFYLLTKRYAAARPYLLQALELHKTHESVLRLADVHLLLFKVDSAQGQLPAAIAHYQQYKTLNDSVFNEAKNKQLASLEIQYDTRKKEQNIALLTKQALLQQARLRQREWQRNALLGGAALLALLLGLGYNRYRLKQRATQQLEAQQQEINHKNESLERLVNDKQGLLEEKEELLQEKDWMLKEIHHRVKNNLQIISSLLSTQADYLRDPVALAALRESQNRVQAIALVHQKLYQSESVALVDMQAYIQEITERLLESFDRLDTVRGQLAIAPVELEVALATPLGLILNEAITNVLKHAFAPGQRGTLRIGLQPSGPQAYELRIADDGVGLPPHFDLSRSQSLGLTMITGLSRQLNGLLRIAPAAPGTQLTLRFEAVPKHPRAEGVLAQ